MPLFSVHCWLVVGLLICATVLSFLLAYFCHDRSLFSVTKVEFIVSCWNQLVVGLVVLCFVPSRFLSPCFAGSFYSHSLLFSRGLSLPFTLFWFRHKAVTLTLSVPARPRPPPPPRLYPPRTVILLKSGSSRAHKLPLLRRVCQRLGLRVVSRAYDLRTSEPFSLEDMVGVFPVVKVRAKRRPGTKVSYVLYHSCFFS